LIPILEARQQGTMDYWLLCIRDSPLPCRPGNLPGKLIDILPIKLSLQCNYVYFDTYLNIFNMGLLWYFVTCGKEECPLLIVRFQASIPVERSQTIQLPCSSWQ